MEVNLRIVTLVNVEEKNNGFFCTTVKGGVVIIPQPSPWHPSIPALTLYS